MALQGKGVVRTPSTGTGTSAPQDELPGDLAALAGVRRFPQRVGCAILSWHALEEALRPDGKNSA